MRPSKGGRRVDPAPAPRIFHAAGVPGLALRRCGSPRARRLAQGPRCARSPGLSRVGFPVGRAVSEASLSEFPRPLEPPSAGEINQLTGITVRAQLCSARLPEGSRAPPGSRHLGVVRGQRSPPHPCAVQVGDRGEFFRQRGMWNGLSPTAPLSAAFVT